MTTLHEADGIGDDTLTRRRLASKDRRADAFRVVVIDDDPSILRLLSQILTTSGMNVTSCMSGMEGVEVLETREWDLCLLDRGLPDLDGLEICRRIKAEPRFDARRVIIVSGYESIDARVQALDLGADDYITKPFHPTELLARVNASRRVVEMQQELVAMAHQLEQLSSRDGLTGIFNRSHFATTLEAAFSHAHRYHRPLSIALIDVDRFKDLNDSFGHPAGDVVLAEVADRFSRSIRRSDYLARYGGEEFVVLLPETDLDEAVKFGEKLRAVVDGAPIPVGEGLEVHATVSVGTASYTHTQFGSPSEMVVAADQALYRAKRNGRNRVELERRRAQRVGAPRPLDLAKRSRTPSHLRLGARV